MATVVEVYHVHTTHHSTGLACSKESAGINFQFEYIDQGKNRYTYSAICGFRNQNIRKSCGDRAEVASGVKNKTIHILIKWLRPTVATINKGLPNH
jgi:hypothetical protein